MYRLTFLGTVRELNIIQNLLDFPSYAKHENSRSLKAKDQKVKKNLCCIWANSSLSTFCATTVKGVEVKKFFGTSSVLVFNQHLLYTNMHTIKAVKTFHMHVTWPTCSSREQKGKGFLLQNNLGNYLLLRLGSVTCMVSSLVWQCLVNRSMTLVCLLKSRL